MPICWFYHEAAQFVMYIFINVCQECILHVGNQDSHHKLCLWEADKVNVLELKLAPTSPFVTKGRLNFREAIHLSINMQGCHANDVCV